MDDLKRIIKLAGRDYVDEADETPAAPAATSDAPSAQNTAAPASTGGYAQSATAATNNPAPAADAKTYTTQKGVMGQPDTQQRSYASFGDFANKLMGKGDVNGKVAAPATPAATSAVPAAPDANNQSSGYTAQAQAQKTPDAPAANNQSSGYAPAQQSTGGYAQSAPAGTTAPNNTPSTANMTNAADTLKAAQAGGANKTGTAAGPAAAAPTATAAVKPAATAAVPAKPAAPKVGTGASGFPVQASASKPTAAPAAKPAAPNQPVAQANAAAAAAGNRGRGATTPPAPAPAATAAAKPAATAAVPAKPAAPAAPKAPAAPAAPKAPAAPAAPAAPKINPQSNNAKAIERKKQEFMDQAKAAGIPAGAIPGSGVNPTSSGSYSVNTGGAKPANTSGVPAQSFQQQGMQSYDFEESYQGRTGLKRSLVSIMEKIEAKNKGELKGGQKKLDKNHNGKLDGDDFKKLCASKVDEADMGKHNNKTTGFKALAKKAAKEYGSKAAGERVAGAVKAKMAKAGQLEETMDESALQAYLGDKKYGKEGMNALRKAGRDGASKEKMAKLRARFDKLDEIVSDTPEPTAGSKSGIPTSATTSVPGMRATPADLRKANSSVVIGEEEYKASVDKSKIPAHLRKAKGGDWKLSTKDLEDEASKSPTSAAGLAKLKKRLGMNENVKVKNMKSNYKNSGNFHKVKDMDKKFESSYTPDDVDNPTQKKSKANHAYGNLKVTLIKEDPQFSAWENQFQSFLAEEISISTTHNTGHKSDNGSGMNIPAPEDTVNISARGEDAKELMKLLQNAGMLGGSDSEEQGHDIELDSPAGDTATISLGGDDDYEQEQDEEEHGHGDGYGTLQVIHPSDSGEMFAGDDKPASSGDMMKDLLDKLTGIGAPDMSDDSDDEDSEEDDTHDHDHDDEEDSDDTSDDSSDDEEDSSEEDSDEDDEEETSEGNKFTGNLAKARAAGKKTADLDGDGDEEKVTESEGTCNECGMYESDCGGSHGQVEEGSIFDPVPSLDPKMKSPNVDQYHGWSDEQKNDPAAIKTSQMFRAYDTDIKNQQKYKDRTAPGIINKVKDFVGIDKPDAAYGPKEVKETDDGAVAHGYEQEEEYVSEGVGMIGTTPEGLENGADDQATQDINFMTKVISGGLNKQKINQHVHPYNNPGPGLSESSKDFMKPVSMKDILSRLTEIK